MDFKSLSLKPGSSEATLFRQLSSQIITLIESGSTQPGQKLPAERELADHLRVARGTVRKAYQRLDRSGLVRVVHGQGYFVAGSTPEKHLSHQVVARELIDTLLDRMAAMKFSDEQILAMLELQMAQRREGKEHLHVLAVDCNPEALAIYERQLGLASSVHIEKMLLRDLKASSHPEQRVANFGLILVTTTHYQELLSLLPEMSSRILEVAVTVGQDTIVELAAIRPSQRIGVLCHSRRFLDIILEKLRSLSISVADAAQDYLLMQQGVVSDTAEFIARKEVLIVPPSFSFPTNRNEAKVMDDFGRRGGKIITFNHQIERGSLLHIRDRIRQIIAQKGSQAE